MGRLIALLAALILGALIAWAGERPASPRGTGTPATEFSATRAMADVAVMGRTPHPVGSPENRRVRDHLVRRMSALGLDAQVRPGVGVRIEEHARFIEGGRVENVIGVLAGRDRSLPAVALMAHYDSVPGSPGAADDAAGVAAALEIVRAIRARGTPARDVVLLITDGEEAGLLGANAFFRRDPLARRIGLVLNMEARGGGGRARMFQTSARNGGLVELLRRNAVRPSSSSLSVFLYEQLPNDTDLTETLEAGVPGMNFAFLGRQFDYHSPTSTPANLEQAALQDLGQQVLEVAAAAAFGELPAPAPPMAYSQAFGDLLVSYPVWIGWALWLATALGVAWAARRSRRAGTFPWSDVARGAAALLFAVLGAVAVLEFARRATGAGAGFSEVRFLLAQAPRWETAVMLVGTGFLLASAAELARGRRLIALVPLLAGLGACVFDGVDVVALGAGGSATVLGLLAFGRPVSRAGAWTGALLLGLLLGLVAQALAPTAAIVLHWPLAVAALMAVVTDAGTRRGAWTHVAMGAMAALAVGWIGGYAHGAFITIDAMPIMALPILMGAFVLWPLAQPPEGAPPGRWLGAALVVAGLAVTAWVRFADPYDARHPEAANVITHVDLDAGRAWRVSTTPDLPAWAQAALGREPQRLSHWIYAQPVRAVPTRATAEGPALMLARRPDGAWVLRAAPPPGGLNVRVRLRPDKPARLESAGGVTASVPLPAGRWTAVRWSGWPHGVDLVLRSSGGGALDVRASAVLPAGAGDAAPLPPLPADTMAWGDSGSIVVTASRRYAW